MFTKKSLVFMIVVLACLGLMGMREKKPVNMPMLGPLPAHDYAPGLKEHYLSLEKAAYIRPGLNVSVDEILIPGDLQVEVTIRITDDKGRPLDRHGLETPGSISASFILAWYNGEAREYTAYTVRTQTSNATGVSAEQATSDLGGSWQDLGIGHYIYKFGTAMPEDYDRSKTHSVAMYLTRDMREFIDDKVYYANLVEDFRPDGETVTESWNAMSNETCNSCHDPLALHGGRRQDVKLCVTCHSPQSLDPDTGNTVDMKVMIHKIHMGAELPSVQAGIPYQIIGFRNSVHDYSHAVFPQSNLNCTTCHPADSPEGDIWYTRPTRASCGSCHDNINWVTGEGHRPGPAENDDTCARCHTPEGESEFDISIIGAHTQPANSTQLAGFNAEILELSNTGPGEHPTVTYRLTNDAGEAIEPSSLPFLNAVLAGPTEDYVTRISERIVEASAQDGDAYSYTFNEMVPNDAEGESYAVALEGFRMVPIDVREDDPLIFRETSNNPVEYFKAGGGEPDLRRMSVTDASCNNCHKDLNFHGTIRQGIEYCVTCHNPTADDSPVRPDEALPARSIDFKFLIHRIHRGQDLDRPYTVYGFGSRPHTYNSVVYPGDLRNCEACHESGSYGLPTPGVEPTFDANEFFSPMLTGSTVCLSCHDTQSAAAHAFVNTAPFGESCASCHGENREFSVTKVHAR